MMRLTMVTPSDIQSKLSALERSTERLQGTDGIRGVTAPRRPPLGEALVMAVEQGVLTAPFFYLYARAFAELARRSGLVAEGAGALVGEDGRDFYRGGLPRGLPDGPGRRRPSAV